MADNWNFDRMSGLIRHFAGCQLCHDWLDHIAAGSMTPSYLAAEETRARYQAQQRPSGTTSDQSSLECTTLRAELAKSNEDLMRVRRELERVREDLTTARRERDDARAEASSLRRERDRLAEELDRHNVNRSAGSYAGMGRTGESQRSSRDAGRPPSRDTRLPPRGDSYRPWSRTPPPAGRRSASPRRGHMAPLPRARSPPRRRASPSRRPPTLSSRISTASDVKSAALPPDLLARMSNPPTRAPTPTAGPSRPLAARISNETTGRSRRKKHVEEFHYESPDEDMGITWPSGHHDDNSDADDGGPSTSATGKAPAKHAANIRWSERSEWHARLEAAMRDYRRLRALCVEDCEGRPEPPLQGCTAEQFITWHHKSRKWIEERIAFQIQCSNMLESWCRAAIDDPENAGPQPTAGPWIAPPPTVTDAVLPPRPTHVEPDEALWGRYPVLRPKSNSVSAWAATSEHSHMTRIRKGAHDPARLRTLVEQAHKAIASVGTTPALAGEGEKEAQITTRRQKRLTNRELPSVSDFPPGLDWLKKDESKAVIASTDDLRWPVNELETRRLVAQALRPGQWVALEKVTEFIHAANSKQIVSDGATVMQRLDWRRPAWASERPTTPTRRQSPKVHDEDEVSLGHDSDEEQWITDPPPLTSASFSQWKLFLDQNKDYNVPGIAPQRDRPLDDGQAACLRGFLRVMELGPSLVPGPLSQEWLLRVLEIELLGESVLDHIHSLASSTCFPAAQELSRDNVHAHLSRLAQESAADSSTLNQHVVVGPIREWTRALRKTVVLSPLSVDELRGLLGFPLNSEDIEMADA